jgi:hypothetical protein
LSKQCGGITREGTRCARSVEGPNGLCWLHDPTRSEERRRAASKAGRSKPNREIQGIKARLEDLADGVLLGTTDRGDAAVVAQVWNTYLRAVSVELKVREQEEVLERLEELEATLERRDKGQGYGA